MTQTLTAFIHDLHAADLPSDVIEQAQRCVLDLIGVAASGRQTKLSGIICDHVATHFSSPDQGARILFDGRRASPVGAALAGGMTIDSLDAHDGHVLTKGHAGAAVFPALLAYVDANPIMSGPEFLTRLVIGYEVATRAGIALHATACDYHTSGAWNALAAAAIGARSLGLSPAQTREALGIAEYHGPRSQMMRCIDHPTMVKDGSGWGAMGGVSAAYLAASGFTGAPALTIESPEVAELWNDLGSHWQIREQYFKRYAVCRWAQPAVEAALALQRAHHLEVDAIEQIDVFSFHEAVRLASRRPGSTEAAQYSLPFPVAAAVVRGDLMAEDITNPTGCDPQILQLSDSMGLYESDAYNARFPAERWAHAVFRLKDGRTLQSEPHIALGNPENPLSDEDLTAKYQQLTEPALGQEGCDLLYDLTMALDRPSAELSHFVNALVSPIHSRQAMTRQATA